MRSMVVTEGKDRNGVWGTTSMRCGSDPSGVIWFDLRFIFHGCLRFYIGYLSN